MGEPLNNYAAVRGAVSMMTDNTLFALRRAAVTVSTVGVIPRIQQMARELPGVSLALSLHAPTQAGPCQLHDLLSPQAQPCCRQGHAAPVGSCRASVWAPSCSMSTCRQRPSSCIHRCVLCLCCRMQALLATQAIRRLVCNACCP